MSTISAAWRSFVDATGNALGFIFISLLGGASAIVKKVTDNEDSIAAVKTELEWDDDSNEAQRLSRTEQRTKEHSRHLFGDDHDSSQPGLVEEVNEMRQDLRTIDEKMDEQHRELYDAVEDLQDD